MSQQNAVNDDATGTASILLLGSVPTFLMNPGSDAAFHGQTPSKAIDTPTLAGQKASARRHIQDVALDFVRAMAKSNPSQPPQIPLKPRPVTFRVGDLESEQQDSPFPSIRSLAQTLKVMQIVHDQLDTTPVPSQTGEQSHSYPIPARVSTVNGAPRPRLVTRRDVYYQDPQLFKSQRTVDAIVHSLALTIDPLSRSHETVLGHDQQPSTLFDSGHLGVVASSRGVALGSCKIRLHPSTSNSSECSVVDLGTAGSTGVLLPPSAEIDRVELDPTVAWVLIVEKDATFQTLAQHGFPLTCTPPGLMVTSRGFPDVATRQFLRLLPEAVQLYTLVDADPFGIHIHWIYQQAMIGRAVNHLGVHLGDLTCQEGGQEKVMPLTNGDVKRIKYLMDSDDVRLQASIMRTLQVMLHVRSKAEIQALGGQLLPYLYGRLHSQPIQSRWVSMNP